MSRDLFTLQQPWSLASFARASTAYGQDGAQVAADVPRYALIDPVVIPGGVNLFPLAAQNFEGDDWQAVSDAVVTVTQCQAVPEWGTLTATRIQTAGGTDAYKYMGLGPLTILSQPYVATLRVKNLGATEVFIDANLTEARSIQPGEVAAVELLAFGNGYDAILFRFRAPSAGDDLDILAWQPMVINGTEAVPFTSDSRDAAMVAGPAGRGLLVEGGVTNLIPAAAQDFDGGGWAEQNGAVVTVTQGQSVLEWATSAAIRIQTAGGTTALKYALDVVAPSVNNQPYTTTLQVKNTGSEAIIVDQILAAGVESVTIWPGEIVPVEITATGDGVTHVGLRFSALAAGRNLDFLAWRPMVAPIDRATTWIDGTRAGEMLNLLADALPISGAQGSWEHDLVISPAVYRQSGTPGLLFHLEGALPGEYIWLGHRHNSAEFRLEASADSTSSNIDFDDSLIQEGMCRLTVTWDAGQARVYIGQELVATLPEPIIPASFISACIGFFNDNGTGINYADCIHQAVRVSNRARTAAEIRAAAGKPLRMDADTTGLWFVPLEGEALTVTNNGQTVQLPPVQRPYSRKDILPQQRGRDSASEVYVYHHGGVRRVEHEPLYRRLSEADGALLTEFKRSALAGVRRRCTWVDYDGTARVVRLQRAPLALEPEAGGTFQVTLPCDEEIAVSTSTTPTGFAAKFAQKTNVAPVWIWKLVVGGQTYWVSDHVRTIASWEGGITTLAWVDDWGNIQQALGGGLNEIRIADYTLTLLNDPDAAPNIETLATTAALEENPSSLYLWEASLDPVTDPPQEKARGYVTGVELPSPTTARITVEDETSRQQLMIGTVITTDAYPNADPDDVGKIFPLPYGFPRNVPGRAVKAGLLTTLKADITAGATTCVVTRADGIVAGTTKFRIGSEIVKVTAINDYTLTIARAQNSTTAAAHSAGDMLLEYVSTPFVFVVSGHALEQILKVTVRTGEIDLDVSDQCTTYTGQPGNQLAGYEGLGVVTITQAQADVIRARAGGITIIDPAHGHSSSVQVMTINPDDYVTNSGGWASSQDPGRLYDGDFSTGAITASSGVTASFSKNQPQGLSGAPKRVRACVQAFNNAYAGGSIDLYFKGAYRATTSFDSDGITTYTGWYTIPAGDQSWANLYNAANTFIRLSCSSQAWPNEVWFEVEYDPSPPSASSNVSGSYNSMADLMIGGAVQADVWGPASDCDDVIAHLLDTWGGISSLTVVGSFPAGYQFSGVIIEQERLTDRLTRLAFQCRSRLRFAPGSATLIVRPDTLTSTATIPACRIDDDGRRVHSRRKTDINQVVNKINLRWDRDWAKRGGNDAYRKALTIDDPASIATYRTRERDDLFLLDFVTSDAMAENVGDFHLADLGERKWEHDFEVFLDQVALESYTVATLGFANDQVGEVTQVNISPGSDRDMAVIGLVVEAPGA